MQRRDSLSLLLSIGLISAAALAYQLLLMRLLAIIQWYPFAAMIISLALLGHGVSGSVLSLAGQRAVLRFHFYFACSAAAFSLTTVLCFALAQRLPFNGLELVWDLRQLLHLSALYALLSLPFFFAASCFGLAFLRFSERIAPIYAADLGGAGLGAAGVVGLLFLLPAPACLRLIAVTGLIGAVPALWRVRAEPGFRFALLLAVAALAAALVPPSWLAPRITEFKSLPRSLQVHGARVLAEHSSPYGLLTVVESPSVPLRNAPGLSLTSRHEPPPQLGIFTDGDALSVITAYDGRREPLAYLDELLSVLPYRLLNQPRVLVLGAGGGAGVLQALYQGARQIDAVELNGQMLALVSQDYAAFAGGIYSDPKVHLHTADGRAFVRRTQEQFDLVWLGAPDSLAAGSAGVRAAAESYALTVEALRDYHARLRPGGYLAVLRREKNPPRDSLKLFATALAALRTAGVNEPGAQLVMVRNWDSSLLLLKNGRFTAADLKQLREFCARRRFDPAYYPGITATEANRYNKVQRPYLYEGAQALLGTQAQDFLADYKFHVAPATDDRPFFPHFFKWRVLPELIALRDQGGVVLLDSGYLLLVAALAQAVPLSLVLILLPLLALPRQSASASRGRAGLYFFCLGLAFLFIEIACMQRCTLLVGEPLLAVAIVLSGFLIFAGLGSGCAHWLHQRAANFRQMLAWVVAGIALAALGYLLAFPSLLKLTAALPLAVKAAVGLGVLAPLGFLMGMPFPLGLLQLAKRMPDFIPWVWGINGCASVLSAILAALLAVHIGLQALILCAVGLYVLAAVAWR